MCIARVHKNRNDQTKSCFTMASRVSTGIEAFIGAIKGDWKILFSEWFHKSFTRVMSQSVPSVTISLGNPGENCQKSVKSQPP